MKTQNIFDTESIAFKPEETQVKAKVSKQPKTKKERNIQKLAVIFINDPSEANFRNLSNRINWGLRSHIYKIVGDNEGTDEVLSKTLENIYFKREQFDPNRAQFSTWMYKIALNNSLKYMQEKHGHINTVNIDFEDLYDSTVCADNDDMQEPVETDTYSAVGTNVDIVYKNNTYTTYDREKVISDFYDASVKCISYLPDNLRVVMHDRLVEQKKINNIAYDNNIPITSVKNWLRKGKTELQMIIKNKYADLYNMYMEMNAAV